MTKKTKNLIVRITEDQFRKLADIIIAEKKNRSTIVRTALHKYLVEYHNKKESQPNK